MTSCRPDFQGKRTRFRRRGWAAFCLIIVLGYTLNPASTKAQEEVTTVEAEVIEQSEGSTRRPFGFPIIRRMSQDEGEANREIVETGAGLPSEKSNPILDKVWSWPTLYLNDDNRFIQKVSLLGRYHTQYYSVDSSQGSAHGSENRRQWAGARVEFLNDFVVAGNVNLRPDEGVNVIDRQNLDTLTIAWNPSDNFQVIVGQQKPGFSQEYEVSSNRMLTFERSLLVNQLVPDKSPGVSAEGRRGNFFYELGGYTGTDLWSGLEDPFALLKLGYDFSELSDLERLRTRFHYLHNSEKLSEAASPYRNSFAASVEFQEGRYAGVVEALYAEGYENVSSAWGISIIPSRFIYQEKVQLVARYHFASSQEDNGLLLQNRYEQAAPNLTGGGLGDRYHSGYLGLNWYLYGRKLKIMTGVEYADMIGGAGGVTIQGGPGSADSGCFSRWDVR